MGFCGTKPDRPCALDVVPWHHWNDHLHRRGEATAALRRANELAAGARTEFRRGPSDAKSVCYSLSRPDDWTVLVYRRPSLAIAEMRDASGELIPYGLRWGEDEPPDEAYSACAHPERFEPVSVVGHALVDYLAAAYEVDRADAVIDGHAQTRLTPKLGGGTTLTFIFGSEDLPGVTVQAGWRFDGRWPDCGCDACDDDVKDLIDELESTVLTIVEGGMSEWRTGPDPSSHVVFDLAGCAIGDDHIPWRVHVRFDGRFQDAMGNESSSWSAGEPEPVEMPTEPHRWPAWPRA